MNDPKFQKSHERRLDQKIEQDIDDGKFLKAFMSVLSLPAARVRDSWNGNIGSTRLRMMTNVALVAGAITGIVQFEKFTREMRQATNQERIEDIEKSKVQSAKENDDRRQARWEEMSARRADEKCATEEFQANLVARFPNLAPSSTTEK